MRPPLKISDGVITKLAAGLNQNTLETNISNMNADAQREAPRSWIIVPLADGNPDRAQFHLRLTDSGEVAADEPST